MKSKMLKGCLSIMSMIFLQGCLNVATTGAQVIYQRHSIQKNLQDQYITMQAYRALSKRAREFRDTHISVSTYHREVLLAGQVPHALQKYQLERIAKNIENVGRVYNMIAVTNPTSALTRISDTWITTKIKLKLIASNDVDGSEVKVVTENGTVYLMGILLPQQADAATEVASHTDGVLKVVRIFSYLNITRHPRA